MAAPAMDRSRRPRPTRSDELVRSRCRPSGPRIHLAWAPWTPVATGLAEHRGGNLIERKSAFEPSAACGKGDACEPAGDLRRRHHRWRDNATHAGRLDLRSARSASAGSITSVAAIGAYRRATPTTDGFVTELDSSCGRRGPSVRRRRRSARRPRPMSRRAASISSTPSQRPDRSDRHDRVRRRDHDAVGRRRRRPSRRERSARCRAGERHGSRQRSWRSSTKYSWNDDISRHRRGSPRSRHARRVIGSERCLTPQAAQISAVTSSGRRLRRVALCGRSVSPDPGHRG